MDTAHNNYQAQIELFEAIRDETVRKPEEIAYRLGISATEVNGILNDGQNLTLTELRLLAIAADLEITYTVRGTVTRIEEELEAFDSWREEQEKIMERYNKLPKWMQ